MQVTIELNYGPKRSEHVRKRDIQGNIDALRRAIDGKPVAMDWVSLADTVTILEGIQSKLPD